MADPEERTPADRIDATRQAARSVMLLLEAIERGELAATPLEIARLRAAAEALKDRRLRAELAEHWGTTQRVWRPTTSLATASRSPSARPSRKPVSATAGSRAATSGTSGTTSARRSNAPRWRLAAVPMWPTSTSEP